MTFNALGTKYTHFRNIYIYISNVCTKSSYIVFYIKILPVIIDDIVQIFTAKFAYLHLNIANYIINIKLYHFLVLNLPYS